MGNNMPHSKSSYTTENGNYYLKFQIGVFSLDTLKRAALKFTSYCSFDFHIGNESIDVTLCFGPTTSEEICEKTIGDYKSEALDQDLRSRIAAETEGYRNLILANVFSKTSIVNTGHD